MRVLLKFLVFCSLGIAPLAWAQLQVVAPVVGSVNGQVTDASGNMVAPTGAMQATVSASDASGSLTATIDGTASTTGALGMALTFNASFDAASGSFVGLYTDKPGVSPDQDIVFTPTGGLSWSAQVAGAAPSSTGDRAYDLSLDFSIPEAAIFSGDAIPSDNVFTGSLSNSLTTSVPVVVPEIQLDQVIEFTFTVQGTWSATVVPQDDGSSAFTGHASGTFSGGAEDMTVSVPLLGSLTVPVSFNGAFSGNLYSVNETSLAFQGSWSAASGDQSFGGDVTITVPLTDLSTFPFEFSGTMPMATGVVLMPFFNLPLNMAGSFPLTLTSP